MLLMDFGAFCSYEMLWDKPVAIVAYSFGGLVFKSLKLTNMCIKGQ